MGTKPDDLWETTILVNNIHCASCVSHIRRVFASHDAALQCISIDISTQAVEVLHQRSPYASKLCNWLSQADFEVLQAKTSDENGHVVQELGTEDLGDALLEAATDLWRPPIQESINDAQCLQFPVRSRSNVLLANCDACCQDFLALSHGSANSLHEKLVHHEWADLMPQNQEIPHQENYDLSCLEEGLSDSMYRKLTSSSSGHKAPDAQRSRHKAVLSIGGMTCASCTSSIDRELSGLPYVDSVNVTLMTNSAKVVFSGNESLEYIVQAVEDLGYDCSVEHCELKDQAERPDRSQSQRRLVMLRIDGMFCNHCPTRVVDAIKANYSDQIIVEHAPTIKDPVIKINYLPNPPNFTIRSVIATIDALEEPFSTNIHTALSIEQRSQQTQQHEQQRLLNRLVGTFIVAIPTLLIGVIWMSLVPSSNDVRRFFEQPVWAGIVTRTNWALFILATPIFFLAADVFHLRAIKEIRVLWRRGSKVPVFQRFYRFGSMNLLVSLGTSIAYFASVAVLALDARAKRQTARSSSTYFDSVVFLTFFILCGRYLEASSKAKTGNAVGLLGNLRPREAVLVASSTLPSASPLPMDGMSESGASGEHKQSRSNTQRINVSLLEVGDVVIVSHGSSPPADGIIVEGSTNFNESSLTGESRAVLKTQGETVFAGAINIGNPILVRVTEVGGTSMLDQIVAVVREGQTKRAPVERVVEFLVGYFVPVITALAVLTFVIWLSFGLSGSLADKYLDDQQGGWAFWSLEFAIAVFVVACPCGIALAAPTALFVGGGLAASHGILVKGGGEAFQEASIIDAVVFDKTGTLTEGGNLKVTDHEILALDEEVGVAWSITKSLEESSSHPLARALLELATPKSPHQIITVSITEEPGLGLRGTFTANSLSPDTATYEAALGSEALIASLKPMPDQLTYFAASTLSTWKSQSKSVALLAIRKVTPSATANPWTLAASFAISDPIRPTALPTISALQKIGIPVYMLTGDNPITAAAVASTLSIPSDHVFAGVLPTEKASKIQWLQEHGPKRPSSASWFRSTNSAAKRAIVAFVGDGINDAPALTTADVSISFSSASDIAMHSSSFILLSTSLTSVLTLFQLSERVFRRVKFNFGWAVIYNVVLIPVAAGCFFRVSKDGWRLGPVWGSAAMALSSLTVILSSLALRWEGKRAKEGDAGERR